MIASDSISAASSAVRVSVYAMSRAWVSISSVRSDSFDFLEKWLLTRFFSEVALPT